MATRTISFHTLVCDAAECDATIGRDEHYGSTIEVRAVAYGQGWRFPARRKQNGEESVTVNDVCPKHVDGWQERSAPNNWANRGAKK